MPRINLPHMSAPLESTSLEPAADNLDAAPPSTPRARGLSLQTLSGMHRLERHSAPAPNPCAEQSESSDASHASDAGRSSHRSRDRNDKSPPPASRPGGVIPPGGRPPPPDDRPGKFPDEYPDETWARRVSQLTARLDRLAPGEAAQRLLLDMADLIGHTPRMTPNSVGIVLRGLKKLRAKQGIRVPNHFPTQEGLELLAMRRRQRTPAIAALIEAISPHLDIQRLGLLSAHQLVECVQTAQMLVPSPEVNAFLSTLREHVRQVQPISREQVLMICSALSDLGGCEEAVRLMSDLWAYHGPGTVKRWNALAVDNREIMLQAVDQTFMLLRYATPGDATEILCHQLSRVVPKAYAGLPLHFFSACIGNLRNLNQSLGTETLLQVTLATLGPASADTRRSPSPSDVIDILRGVAHMPQSPGAASLLRLLTSQIQACTLDINSSQEESPSSVLVRAMAYLDSHFPSPVAVGLVLAMREWLALPIEIDAAQISDKASRNALIRRLNQMARYDSP